MRAMTASSGGFNSGLHDHPGHPSHPSLRLLHYALLGFVLLSYVYLGVVRAIPENLMMRPNINQSGGAVKSSVAKVYSHAMAVGLNPNGSIWDLDEHLVFRGHNPGMFKWMGVVLYESGLDTLFQIQMFPLALNTLTLLLIYALFRKLFRQPWIGLFSAAFLAFCPVFLTQATSLGSGSYAKLFQIASALLLLIHLRDEKRGALLGAAACYFLACWNYWEWYISTALVLMGIHYAERGKVFARDVAILAWTPVAAFVSFLIAMVVHQGGVVSAGRSLVSAVMFRAFDRPRGGEFFGKTHRAGRHLNLESFGGYLETIGDRIETWYYLSPIVFALMLAAVLYAHEPTRTQAYRVIYFLVPAAFYWNFLMLQHGVIHFYTALHHYLLLALIFGAFVVEIPAFLKRRLGDRPFRRWIAALLLFPVIYPVVSQMTADISKTQALYRARAAGELHAQPSEAPRPKPPRSR